LTFPANLYCFWLKKAKSSFGQRKFKLNRERISNFYLKYKIAIHAEEFEIKHKVLFIFENLCEAWLIFAILHASPKMLFLESEYPPTLTQNYDWLSHISSLTVWQLTPDLPKVRTFDSHFLKDACKLFPWDGGIKFTKRYTCTGCSF
jgi:hypothetical protein